MLVWNRDKQHYFLSPSDRKRYIYSMQLGNCVKWFETLSFWLNVAVPLIMYFTIGLNLITFGIVFIAMDVILNLFEQLFFITLPYLLSKTKNISVIQRRINSIKKKKEKVEKRISFLRDKHCKNCERVCSWNREDCTRCDTMEKLCDKKDALERMIRREEKYIETLNIKPSKVKENKKIEKQQNKPAKIVEEKKVVENNDYFANVANQLNDWINKGRYDFLIPLRKSVNSISQILKTKPNGKKIIPTSLSAKLDTILILLNTVSDLENDEKRKYIEEIKDVSKKLNEEIQLLVLKLNKVKDDEVSTEIDSMLEELKKESNENA